jgi:class 3 adenylate cyclase/tetratricopeptide (TPR) repeat protein
MGVERKLATVLFVDLVDSTGLVTTSDPEVVRRRVSSFFEHVSNCIELHGGLVEKFAGDAVMAAFGVPQTHEDDAERAVRAGLDILESTRELGLEARVGVESGEVVFDQTESTFATGEAVTLAARLQQTAKPGQILIGPGAYRLTLDRIEVEDVGPVQVRGRQEPLWAWRATAAVDGAVRRATIEAPLIGREVELALLENTFTRAERSGRAHLVTLFGEPGVGKSRLAREFVGALEGATVLFGRCLPYGEAITYWPVGEMVKTAAGITDDEPVRQAFEKLRSCCEDEAVADLLALASGVLAAVEGERTSQEIAWAAGEWAEKLSDPQPLVLWFEDVHWAEEPLLELIEHLAERVRGPLVILCLARTELLETRPDWGGGRMRAATIELDPLVEEESEALVDALLASTPLAGDCRDEILEVTEGNPLFVEETIRMLAENPDGDVRMGIPNTLQALIAARIDHLPLGAKTVLQRASVVGRIFWEGAIEHLAPEADNVESVLDDLLLREFILPESRSSISGERAYRFKHVLIREVAYGGLSKSARAEHHRRFADWVGEKAGEELLEIRGYHLDQAAGLLAELDGAAPPELADEAAETLESAGWRALARESFGTARKLFLRAYELGPTLERRWLAARMAQRLGDWPAVASEMEAVRAGAAEVNDSRILGRALTALAEVALYQGADAPRARDLVDQALELLEEVPQPDARFEALMMRSSIEAWLGELGEAKSFLKQAIEVAHGAGRKDLETIGAQTAASNYIMRLDVAGAEPLIERAMELAEESGSVLARAAAFQSLGLLHQVKDELDESEAAFTRARELYEEVGYQSGIAWSLDRMGWIAYQRGDLDLAAKRLKKAIQILKPLGERGYLCEALRKLAQVLVDQGKVEEAERVALEARETVGPEDAVSQITTTMALGIVRAAQHRDEEAERLLRSAVDAAYASHFRVIEPGSLRPLIAFLQDRGRADEAEPYEARLDDLTAAVAAA